MSIAPDDRRAFHDHGVVCLRERFSEEWVDMLRGIVDSRPAKDNAGGFIVESGVFVRDPVAMRFCLSSPLGPIAASLLDADSVRLYEDTVMVKRAGSGLETPWHRDAEYYDASVLGRLCTLWIALDPVTAANGGVHYVRGSHRDETPYRVPLSFHEPRGFANPDGPPMPDYFREHRDRLVNFELAPGDVVVHEARTIHGAPPNRAAIDRRAVAFSIFAADRGTTGFRPKWPVIWSRGGEHS